MTTFESPGAMAALGASVVDQLGGGSFRKLVANGSFHKLRSAQRAAVRETAP
jgi:hypothetical protein